MTRPEQPQRMRNHWPSGALLLSLILTAACGASQKPATGSGTKNAALERRVEELERRLDKLQSQDQINEAIATEIVSLRNRVAMLEGRGGAGARMPPRRGAGRPDPAKVYAVPILGNPHVGPKHAWVTVVKGFDFACPFCDRNRATLDQLQKEYGKDLKIVYKNFIVHPQVATIPAQAACAAHQQGAFKKMYDLIWTEGFHKGRDLSRDNMLRLARRLKLKMKKFEHDMDGVCPNLVQADQAELTKFGTRGTPAFFINGRFLSGAQPIDKFRTLIDEELKKAKSSGVGVKDYYDHILESGLKKVAN